MDRKNLWYVLPFCGLLLGLFVGFVLIPGMAENLQPVQENDPEFKVELQPQWEQEIDKLGTYVTLKWLGHPNRVENAYLGLTPGVTAGEPADQTTISHEQAVRYLKLAKQRNKLLAGLPDVHKGLGELKDHEHELLGTVNFAAKKFELQLEDVLFDKNSKMPDVQVLLVVYYWKDEGEIYKAWVLEEKQR